jgi:hypothetical protein
LPQEDVPVHPPLPATSEPHVDYNHNYIFTSDEFVASLEAKAACRNQLVEEARLKKLGRLQLRRAGRRGEQGEEESREKKRLEKLEKERKSKERAAEHATQKREKQYWDNVKKNGWSDKLHKFIRVSVQNPNITLRTPQNLVVPSICRYNQRIDMLRARFKKEGKNPRLVAPAMTVQPYMRDPQWATARPSPFNHSPW